MYRRNRRASLETRQDVLRMHQLSELRFRHVESPAGGTVSGLRESLYRRRKRSKAGGVRRCVRIRNVSTKWRLKKTCRWRSHSVCDAGRNRRLRLAHRRGYLNTSGASAQTHTSVVYRSRYVPRASLTTRRTRSTTAAVRRALELGVKSSSTLRSIYRFQRSERAIGLALRGVNREEVFISTKAGFLTPDGDLPANPRVYFEEEYFARNVMRR